jgi:hypothetical protein
MRFGTVCAIHEGASLDFDYGGRGIDLEITDFSNSYNNSGRGILKKMEKKLGRENGAAAVFIKILFL